MKHTPIIITIILIAVLCIAIIVKKSLQHKTTRFTIGILQTASHPALDAAHDGFVQTLKELLNNDVTFIEYNAQGSIPNAHTSAQSLHANKKVDGVFAIATPAAQAISAVEKKTSNFYFSGD